MPIADTELQTPRLLLRSVKASDAPALRDYYLRNADHLRGWEPQRSATFFVATIFVNTVANWQKAVENGLAVRFVMALRAEPESCIGVVNFTGIVGPPFQACTLGYGIDAAHQGQGLMREALTAAIAHMQTQHHMHRIMANHLPHNHRSAALLQALGFVKEGDAKDYLQIAGRWQDHVLTALTDSRIAPVL